MATKKYLDENGAVLLNQLLATKFNTKADKTEIPTKTSDLNNDSNFAVDANYVHTDNNYTTTEKNKLSGIESGAQVNKIETIKVNNVAQTITSKAVDITVPTNNNQLINGAGYITKSVDDLTNYTTTSDMNNLLGDKLDASLKGAANGLAELDETGKVPSSQLPAYVDDVIEGYYYNGKFYKEAAHTTEITGETGKIYVDLPTNVTYRWGGSTYVEISSSLALGETSSTAYYGDKGKTAYNHATDANRLTTAKSSAFYKFATTAEGHIKSVTSVAKSDLTGLGVEDASNKVTSISGSSTDTQYPSAKLLYDQLALKQGNLTAGTNINIASDGTISATDTTYNDFVGTDGTTAGTHGLVPAPTTSEAGRFLKADGTWANPVDTTYTAGDYIDITNNIISLVGEPIHTIPLTQKTITLYNLDPGIYWTGVDTSASSRKIIDNNVAQTTIDTLNNNQLSDRHCAKSDYIIIQNQTSSGANKKSYIILSTVNLLFSLQNPKIIYGVLDETAAATINTIDWDKIQSTTNLVTSIDSSSTDTQYPSAKLLYDQLALKQATLTAGTNIDITNNTIGTIGDTIKIIEATSDVRIDELNSGTYKIVASQTSGTIALKNDTNKTIVSGLGNGAIAYVIIPNTYNGSMVSDNQYAYCFYNGEVYVATTGLLASSKTLQNKENLVTSLSSSSTNIQYPSAKLVYDQLALKLNSADLVALTNQEVNTIFDFEVANS